MGDDKGAICIRGAHVDLGNLLASDEMAPLTDADGWLVTRDRGEVRNGQLHFLADSNAAITKGIVSLVIAAVQDKPAAEVAQMDVTSALEPFDLRNQLSSNRTQGVPNMIALVQEHAARIAAG